MATITALQTEWVKLGEALGAKCAGTSGQVGSRCTGAIFRHAQISGRVAAWNDLPAGSATFDPVIATLDDACQELSRGASLVALASANGAMDRVETLLPDA